MVMARLALIALTLSPFRYVVLATVGLLALSDISAAQPCTGPLAIPQVRKAAARLASAAEVTEKGGTSRRDPDSLFRRFTSGLIVVVQRGGLGSMVRDIAVLSQSDARACLPALDRAMRIANQRYWEPIIRRKLVGVASSEEEAEQRQRDEARLALEQKQQAELQSEFRRQQQEQQAEQKQRDEARLALEQKQQAELQAELEQQGAAAIGAEKPQTAETQTVQQSPFGPGKIDFRKRETMAGAIAALLISEPPLCKDQEKAPPIDMAADFVRLYGHRLDDEFLEDVKTRMAGMVTGMGKFSENFRDSVCAYGHVINFLVHETRERVKDELLKRGR